MHEDIGQCYERNLLIVSDAIKLLDEGYKVLICVSRTSHGKALYDLLNGLNIEASFPYKIKVKKKGIQATVDHKKLRKDVLEIEKGNIHLLIGTYKLFDTGFDCPELSAILYAAPFSGDNATQIVKSVGRIQRFRLDKKHPIDLDYTDQSHPVDILGTWANKRAEHLQKRFRNYDIIR